MYFSLKSFIAILFETKVRFFFVSQFFIAQSASWRIGFVEIAKAKMAGRLH